MTSDSGTACQSTQVGLMGHQISTCAPCCGLYILTIHVELANNEPRSQEEGTVPQGQEDVYLCVCTDSLTPCHPVHLESNVI